MTAQAFLQQRVFIVTGAASGIGRALSRRLLDAGHCVCACDIDAETLAAVYPDSAHCLAIPLDVRMYSAWQAAVEQVVGRWGRVDVLCNIAGILQDNWVVDVQPGEIDRHLDINTKGVMLGMHSVLPHMTAQGGGHIVNMASMAGIAAIPGLALYSASKFAVRAYSLAAAVELAPKGIVVSVVCPDAVQTPMLDRQRGRLQTALTFSGGRILTADDIAEALMTRVFPHRPVELALPSARGWLAKLSNTFVGLTAYLVPKLQQKGLRRQHTHPHQE
ncbi:SDR family oxidoreductase [Neisseria leonii]|uniref:SDR family oxidoreductase n=1 Tax=Neisseria leonii TaxID=2995413 RepID=UPI00237A2402|nr:SDR family oxidoreductase [Neisseria sp. 3986]MDD9325490.1 SDR family oxidoreductase [Neisseria sp. 3986]